MRRRWVLLLGGAALGAPLTFAGALDASDDPAVFELACPSVGGPGRVVCVLRVTPVQGRVAWADAVVRSAPPIARPLRARAAASSTANLEEAAREVALALVAAREGRGRLVVDGRAVVCVPADDGRERCTPVVSSSSAEVVVGVTAR